MAADSSAPSTSTSQPAPSSEAAIGVPGNLALYVGDLDPSVNEGQLFDLFGQVAPVVSIRVFRDHTRASSLGYAYVNYAHAHEAARALEVLNYTLINGKPIRIMYSHRDSTIRRSGYANVFIKNLDTSIDNKALHDTFSAFGTVLSSKVVVDSNGQSKGHGYVQFENEESAQNAIKQLNGMLLNEKQVYVGLFVRREERTQATGLSKFTNVYVKNLPKTTTDEDLKKLFSSYGMITSAVVMKEANGKSRCFGFVNFQSPDDAAVAVEKLNGATAFDDKVLFVGRAQSRGEREAELKANFEQERNSRYEKSQGANLYLKNLDDNVNDDKLRELFSEFGTITSCKVMVDPHGHSKGYGFVAFSTPQEAAKALEEMNGKMMGQKPLYVAVAQRKEDRKAQLQAHFSQIQAHSGMAQMPAGIAGFHPGGPRFSPQHLYFGQGNPGLLPPQPYGFQQQLFHGMRPGIVPNFMMPYHLQRQGQPGQQMGVRRVGNLQQVQQQQQQLMHHNPHQGFRYVGSSRTGVDASVVPQGVIGPVMSLPFDGSGRPATPIDMQRPGHMHTSALLSALASASPENQRAMLGEQLYPHVEQLEPKNAAKVTGMLLEMDKSEVIHLLESPDALKQKVAEAMEVLHKAASDSGVSDQLGSLALND